MDSNQGYNLYKWVICPLTRVINLHITSYIQYPEPLSIPMMASIFNKSQSETARLRVVTGVHPNHISPYMDGLVGSPHNPGPAAKLKANNINHYLELQTTTFLWLFQLEDSK